MPADGVHGIDCCMRGTDEGEEKQAILIMADRNACQLGKLLTALDDPRYDIFLHIDAKSRLGKTFRPERYVRQAGIQLIPPMKVYWGGYSQVECELALLRAATDSEHSYYHLISGLDLPLHPADDVISFFQLHRGTEYVSVEENESLGTLSAEAYNRVAWRYPLQNSIFGGRSLFHIRSCRAVQRLLRVDCIRERHMPLAKGPNWFSITDAFARYVLSESQTIRHMFKSALCPDELFMQTILINSPFAARSCDLKGYQNTRLIDWKRGGPYTFLQSDAKELANSPALFARKFDEVIDSRIIDEVIATVKRH